MDEGRSWLRTHWRTALALLLIFGVALFIRFYFVYGLAFTNLATSCDAEANLPVSGGSDSYYWHRALCYSFQTGKDLTFDTMLNYGPGLYNPRPPLFPWFSLLLGQLIAPIFASPWQAVLFTFLASTGLFGALTVFPTYALTKEAFGRRAGLVAALLVAVSAAHMQRSQATDADHDALTLFFVVSTFYFFLRALRVMQPRRWVETWFRRDAIVAGVRGFFAQNRTSVLYALLAGLCIAVIALSWQGWAYVPVILLVFFVVQLFLDRVRNQDTMGVTILFTIALLVPLVVAFPWYASRLQIRVWFDVPAYLFLVAAVLGTVFTVTRDYPWTLVIPSTLIAGAVTLGVLVIVNPALANAFVSGAGYFVQTKVYETIAEAQAPGLSQLILSFGFFTFYFSVGGVAYMVWLVPRRHDAAYTLIVVWTFAAIFMAMAAARFIFNASPAFAVAAAYAIDLVLRRADFAGMRRTYRSLAAGSWRNAVRKSVKLRHILTILVIVGAVLVPNVYWGVDAGIPFELKSTYDRQLYDILPSFLRAPGYDQGGGSFYFGAFGYAIPQASEYFPAAWTWFRTQDADRPPESRPAFLSWWDYGFEAVDRGQHPTVADNFQNGFNFAGQFITAQDEAQAVALLAIRSIEGDFRRNRGAFGEATERALEAFGMPASDFARAIARPQDLIRIVQGDPGTYGRWDAEMQPFNAMYIYLAKQVDLRLDADRIADFYKAVRTATGIDTGYFAVDTRLFPISAGNTGIFYAPVKLSDHRVVELPDGRTLPTEFFRILVNTDRGEGIPLEDIQPGDRIQSQSIEYQSMFYNSMFYRAYVGYAPADVGFPNDKGIPGFTDSMRAFAPHPAWNLSHFRLVYRTSYYNPFPDPGNHSEAWRAMNYDEAARFQDEIEAGTREGIVDRSTQAAVANGIVFLRYYDGAWVNGTVLAGGVTPVSGVRVTVTDELGTPHDTTFSDAQGRYSVLVPFGNVTITASVGQVAPGSLNGARTLASATFPVSLAQALRENVDEDGDGTPDWILARDLSVPGRALSGRAFLDLNADGTFGVLDEALPDAIVTLDHKDLDFAHTATADSEGNFALPMIPTGGYRVGVEASGHTVTASDVEVSSSDTRKDVAVPFGIFTGIAEDKARVPVAAEIRVVDEATGEVLVSTASAAGTFDVRPLLDGNYTVTATSGDLASNPERVRATRGATRLNLTLVPSGRVVGTTLLFGSTLPFASFELQRASEIGLVRTVRSDATASFDVTLPSGEWNVNGRVYQGSSLYATLGRVTVRPGELTTLVVRFVDGARLEGVVNGTTADGPDLRAQLAFRGTSGEWWLRTGQGKGYLVFLPRGTYSFQAFTSNSALQGNATLVGSQERDVQLVAATSASGLAFRDLDANGFPDPGEGVAGAAVRLTDNLGQHVFAVADDAGAFQVVGFANRSYDGTIDAPGFETRVVTRSSLADIRSAGTFELRPNAVEVRGSLLLDGVPLLVPGLSIRTTPLGAGARTVPAALTDSNGGFFLSLVPGRYELVVDENASGPSGWRYQNLQPDELTAEVGSEPIVRDLELVLRARVTGNVTRDGSAVAAAVNFDGPDTRSVATGAEGYEVYLQAGTYSVRAAYSAPPDAFGFLDSVDVSGPVRLSLAVVRASAVSGRALFQNVAVTATLPIRFEHRDGGALDIESTVTGTYETVLVPGTYSVHLDAERTIQEGTLTRFYRFTFDGTLVVASGGSSVTFPLDLARTLDNTTVVGRTTRDGVGVESSLSFFARAPGALDASGASGSDGTFAIGLVPGTYDVYATRALGSSAFLGTLTVPHADSTSFDMSLRAGFRLAGVVTDVAGARVLANLTIRGDARLDRTTTAQGAYEVLLPGGSYTVTASRTGTERGISIEYNAASSVDLASDTVLNLRLAKVERRSVTLSWNGAQQEAIPPGGSVVYSVTIRNAGNVADTYTLSGRPSGWTFDFSPESLSLNFGTTGSTGSATVTIHAPADATVVHGPITVVATSSDGSTSGSVNVDIGITRTRGLALDVLTSTGTFNGVSLEYAVEVRNTGNALDTVTVYVANANDLAASGWTASLGREGDPPPSEARVDGVAVGANATTRLTLVLRSPVGASGATVVLQAFSNDFPSVTASDVHIATLPNLVAPGGVQATGRGVVQTLGPNWTLVSVAAAAGAAVAVGWFLTRRRR